MMDKEEELGTKLYEFICDFIDTEIKTNEDLRGRTHEIVMSALAMLICHGIYSMYKDKHHEQVFKSFMKLVKFKLKTLREEDEK